MILKNESDDGNDVWSTVIVIVVALIAAGFILPMWRVPATRGPLTDNLNNAKQVAVALRMYAYDNEDRFPKALQEIMPKYCTSNAVLLTNVADGKTKVPWQYFPGHKSSEEPPVIVIRSSPNSKGDWVAGYSDGSARIIYKADKNSSQ